MGKVVEKIVAQQLAFYYKIYSKLHLGQRGAQKEKSAIDAIFVLVHKIQELWEEKKLVGAIFIDIKGVFDYISKNQLLRHMIELGIDKNLIA